MKNSPHISIPHILCIQPSTESRIYAKALTFIHNPLTHTLTRVWTATHPLTLSFRLHIVRMRIKRKRKNSKLLAIYEIVYERERARKCRRFKWHQQRAIYTHTLPYMHKEWKQKRQFSTSNNNKKNHTLDSIFAKPRDSPLDLCVQYKVGATG